MQAPFEMDEGLNRLKCILDSFPGDSAHWNEAQNRFQFIDRLLTECLGWEKPHINVEHYDDFGGRSDYRLGLPPKAILEAKRQGIAFEIPPIGKKTLVRKLRTLIFASKAFEEAVGQILPYCQVAGAQIGIVCNGPQLVIFQSMTPGMSPLDGECYLFDGFGEYVSNFHALWRYLSPEGIAENRAFRELSINRSPRIPPRPSQVLTDPLQFRYRNPFQENLNKLASLLLEEIEDNPALKTAFYRECYVRSDANNRHLLLSKNVITSRYKRLSIDSSNPEEMQNLAKTNTAGELLLPSASLGSGAGSRPIVVIGDVGVGKTSFFQNLYESLAANEKTDAYFITIDLGIKANLSDNLKSYVLQAIPQALRRNYGIDIEENTFVQSIYYEQIANFEKSIYGILKQTDPKAYNDRKLEFLAGLVKLQDSHLHASLGHLARGRRKQIVLVLDNADQRSFTTQQEAFLIAQELAATRNLFVFVALRPSTFYRSKLTGALSGYQSKLLTISPPPADEVVRKRLTFALRVADGQIEPTVLQNTYLNLSSVVSFITAMLRSLRTNDDIGAFIANITGGNTRAAIELITGFFGSPNVDSRKIVRIEEQQGNYLVPLHEFTKHALLGEYAYYNSQSSLYACNIYDIGSADPREHFLAGLIIAYLSSNVGLRDNDGYLTGKGILEEMAKHGFVADQARFSLRRLAAAHLIETPYAHYRETEAAEPEQSDDLVYRATSVGIYHIRHWAGTFSFLDATSIDTPIFEEASRAKISDLAASFDIGDRYLKALEFRHYLHRQWNEANIGASYFDFEELLRSQNASFVDTYKHLLGKTPSLNAQS